MFQISAGGHAIKGETPVKCAIRELREETGVLCSELKELYISIVDDGINPNIGDNKNGTERLRNL